jgi:Zn-finger nucleic acid-binding protein
MNDSKTVCQHCGHTSNGVVRICPICGGEIIRDITGIAAKCPRCSCELEKSAFNSHNIEKCPKCSGIWVHTRVFEELTNERDVYLDTSVSSDFVRKPPPQPEGYLSCACCGKSMGRLNFRSMSGIVIDVCRDCGCWLDAGELESIRSFIAAGGIDKSQDREITSVKTDVSEIEGRVDQLEFMQKVLNRWKLKSIIFNGL